MFAEKVIELLKEAERNRDTIDPFNVSSLRVISTAGFPHITLF